MLLAITSDEARRQANEILSRREFKANELQGPFSGYLRAFGRLIERLFKPFFDFVKWVGDWLGTILNNRIALGVLALIVLGLVARWAIRKIRRHQLKTADRVHFQNVFTSKDAYAHYQTARSANDWATALRFLYVAGVLQLYEKDLIVLCPGTTNAQIVSQMARPELSLLTREFERSFYGDSEVFELDVIESERLWNELSAGKK